jgi:hypothetical protein
VPDLLFTHAGFLAGLGALAIPILIHLLLKRKSQRLRFSTLQFFQRPDERSSRRKKLRNWLLLATRLLLLALLVLAFARPYLARAPGAAGQRQRRGVVFVLDRSASMQAGTKDRVRSKEAAAAIRSIIDQLDAEDRAALVSCATHAEVLSPLVAPARLKSQLNDLSPGFGASNLAEGLAAAVRLLGAEGPGRLASICVVSDLQRSACERLSASPIPKGIDVLPLPVGEPDTPNLAVTELRYEPRSTTPLHATIANFSQRDASALSLEDVVDGGAVVSQRLAVAAGTGTNLVLSSPSLPGGWHTIVARINPSDSFALDDVRYQAVYVPQPIRVLCVDGRKGSRIFEEESFFFASALNPSTTTNRSGLGFAIEKIAPEALAQRLAGQPRPGVVVLPALRQVPAGAGKALTSYVRAGGGLLLFAGDAMTSRRYNEELRELLPAVLAGTGGNPAQRDELWHLQDIDKQAEAFAAFRQPNSGDFSLPEFKRRVGLVPAESSHVLARFTDGAPMMVARASGAGRVVWMNTSMDTSWTDWPKHKTYVPAMHGLTRYLSGALSLEAPAAAYLVAGSESEIELGAAAATRSFQLLSPDGKNTKVSADANGRLRLELDRPGIYALHDAGGVEIRRLAVNLPQTESDLLANTPNEFQQQLVRSQPAPGASGQVVGLLDEGERGKPLWQSLMAGVLALLLIEVVLANRTSA